ncbi:uncharacterized protein LOC117593610 [Esox lucius]|uniref:uncharacterized protein LOC117593610 n=1 Tax=Esox lucius TaxID=8010 RepID=UPI001476FF74|nr:uncharacterized protein LOC117593610 [Esox lucius]
MRVAGQRVRPNLSRFTVASIILTYRQENRTARRPAVGGRQRVFTHAQELAVVNLVVANNAITLRQLRERILEDQAIFHNVHSVSTTTLARVLREHHVSMKQLYKVPFERNSVAVKNLRYDYVQNKIFKTRLFSAWRWKVYDRLPHVRVPLLRAMEEACGDIEVGSIHGWIRHTRRYFPRCLAREDIACDVDEVLWPDPNRRRDP